MKLRYLLCIWLPLTLQAQGPASDIVIRGELKGLPDNTEVYLGAQDPSQKPICTAVSGKGRFELKGSIDKPDIYILGYKGSEQKAYLFLEPSTIGVKGHKDSLNAVVVSGSESQRVFAAFNSEFGPLFSRISQLSQKMSTQRDAATMKEYEELVAKVNEASSAYVERNKASVVSPFAVLVLSQLNENPAFLSDRYALLTEAVRQSHYGKILGQMVEDAKVGAIGSQAIEFTQNDTDGKPVSLSSFRGKYVLVDFWASWCRPCRVENPNVVEAFRKYSPRNFTVLGVSLDRSREPWLQAIKDDRLEWTHVSDLKFWSNEVAQKYRISSIPQNLLIDPSGVIIAKNLRGEELQRRLAELLK